MSPRLILPLGVIGFVLLCIACVFTHSRSMQSDLLTRSTSALAAAGIPDVDLTFSGRDATLVGTVGSQDHVRLAGQTVGGQRGVRVVDNRLQVAMADLPPVERLAPAPRPEEFQRGLDAQLAGRTIEFESGRAVITLQGRFILDALSPLFEAYPDALVEVGGHTDSSGNAEANLELSRRRAAAVKQYLVDHGVEQHRLITAGYGETTPIADNETVSGRRNNRRITFTVSEGS